MHTIAVENIEKNAHDKHSLKNADIDICMYIKKKRTIYHHLKHGRDCFSRKSRSDKTFIVRVFPS